MRRTPGVVGAAAALLVGLLGGPALASTPTGAQARAADLVSAGALPADPSTGKPLNNDAEPGVAVAPDGTLWATAFSLSDPAGGQDIWRSTDGGGSWQWVAAPFNVPPSRPLLGGDDADVAVATSPNGSGHYNVYVAGLWVVPGPSGLLVGDISVALSTDGGRSWLVDPLAAEVPSDDRPWLAADGACTVDLVYHTVAETTVVNTYDLCNPVSTVVGLTLTPVASTRFTTSALPFLLQQKATYVEAGFGKAVVDTSPTSPYRHRLYIPQADCPSLTPMQEVQREEALSTTCPPGDPAEVYVAVSPDGGRSWQEIPVARSEDTAVPIWPATIATDSAGRVYLAWHDNLNAWLDTSTDGGRTWSPPEQLNAGLGSAVYPTVTAGGPGVVDVAWYGAYRAGDANDQTVMGTPGSTGGARWSLWIARSMDGGHTFQRFVADPTVHSGMLCTEGDACTVKNSRDLFDDFGAVTSPTTATTTVVYTSDQPGGTTAGDAVRSVSFRAG